VAIADSRIGWPMDQRAGGYLAETAASLLAWVGQTSKTTGLPVVASVTVNRSVAKLSQLYGGEISESLPATRAADTNWQREGVVMIEGATAESLARTS
jgi:hypothetical protein